MSALYGSACALFIPSTPSLLPLCVFVVAMQKMLSDSYAMSLLQEASDCRRRNLVSKAYMRLNIHTHILDL